MQMAEHELALVKRFFAIASAQVPADATQHEIHTALLDLLRNDHKAYDLAERLAAFQQLREEP